MSAPIPRGLHHLESKLPHSHHFRYSPRVLHQKKFVQPTDRIKYWNIRSGDKVRLMVGKEEEKFHLDESSNGEGSSSKKRLGWKVHEVTGHDMERNTLLLKTVTYKKSNPIQARPSNFDSFSDEEKQQFNGQQNFLLISRPVHYSNVQLCVKERPISEGGSLFATRLKTSPPEYDKLARRIRYERYPAKVVDEAGVAETPGEDGFASIPWPEIEPKKIGDPSEIDTRKDVVLHQTLDLSAPHEIWSDPAIVPLPNSTRAASLQLPRAIADKYMAAMEDASSRLIASQSLADGGEAPETYADIRSKAMDPVIDSLMPLYLGEELSPRFSRAKATAGWNLRKDEGDRERKAHVAKAVAEWRSNGKDRGLEKAMEQVGLDGVKLRRRTLNEVEESAAKEYDAARFERGRIMRLARAHGGSWDLSDGRWKVELTASEIRRKDKKIRRREAREEKLRTMPL